MQLSWLLSLLESQNAVTLEEEGSWTVTQQMEIGTGGGRKEVQTGDTILSPDFPDFITIRKRRTKRTAQHEIKTTSLVNIPVARIDEVEVIVDVDIRQLTPDEREEGDKP